jgi:hypothetical protein
MYDRTTLSKRYFTISGKSHELPFTSISCRHLGIMIQVTETTFFSTVDRHESSIADKFGPPA